MRGTQWLTLWNGGRTRGMGPVISEICLSQHSLSCGISASVRECLWGGFGAMWCTAPACCVKISPGHDSCTSSELLVWGLAWGPKGLGTKGTLHCSAGNVQSLSILHDPALILEDWQDCVLPHKGGTQNHIVSVYIRNVEVNLWVYGPKFHLGPCPIVDLRAQASNSELQCHLLL